MKRSGRKYDIALMTNELSAHAEHSLTPVEFSTLADGIRAELDEITSEYVTHPDGIGAANSGKVVTEDATDVNSGNSITFPSSDPGPDQARKSVKAALVLDRPQEASERYANLCLLATELAGLSTADRVQHPSYRGEQQNGEHFSDIRLTHEGKEYVALKPYSSSHRKAFEDRIAGLS